MLKFETHGQLNFIIRDEKQMFHELNILVFEFYDI